MPPDAAQPVRRPLAAVCAAFVFGTWLGVRTLGGGAAPWLALLAAAALLLACRAAGRRRPRPALRAAATAAVLAATLLCALLSGSAAARRRMAGVEVFRDAVESGEPAVLRGRVATEPSVVALEHGGARMRFDLRVAELAHEAGPVPAGGCTVRVDWYGPVSMASPRPPFPLPRAGEGWQLSGTPFEVQTRSAAPLLVLARRERDPVTRRAPELDASRPALLLRDLRAAAARALGRGAEDRPGDVALVRAMTLGLRAEIPRDLEDRFKASGTIHVFAISGLHVGLFALLLSGAFRFAGVPFRLRAPLSAAAVVLYVAITGARPSAVRACAMTLLVLAAPLASRRADPAASLAAAAIAILAWDPMQVLDLGFHFSFLCTGGILLLVPLFNGLREAAAARRRSRRAARTGNPEDADPPPRVRSPEWSTDRWCRRSAAARAALALPRLLLAWGPARIVWWLRHRLPGRTAEALSVSLAAWLVSAPLTAMCFGRLSPVAILANLAVIPLASFVVGFALASLLAAPLVPALSALLNRACAFLAHGMSLCSQAAAALPGGALEVAPWHPAAVAAWYAALLLAVLLLRPFAADPGGEGGLPLLP